MRGTIVAGGLGVAAAVLGWKVFDPWQQRWGATPDEVVGDLPGDDLTPDPDAQATRAISIAASPEQVWPWLVQMGADRGGFATYDWLENLFGLDIHNADHIVEEWQDLAVGDMVWADRSHRGGWVVEMLVPNEVIVMKMADPETRRATLRTEGTGFEFQWTFALRPIANGRTRLLVRERTAFGKRLTRWAMAPVGLVSFVMTRRMLDGIRRCAERGSADQQPAEQPADQPAVPS